MAGKSFSKRELSGTPIARPPRVYRIESSVYSTDMNRDASMLHRWATVAW